MLQITTYAAVKKQPSIHIGEPATNDSPPFCLVCTNAALSEGEWQHPLLMDLCTQCLTVPNRSHISPDISAAIP